jgi:hypothetical protein
LSLCMSCNWLCMAVRELPGHQYKVEIHFASGESIVHCMSLICSLLWWLLWFTFWPGGSGMGTANILIEPMSEPWI